MNYLSDCITREGGSTLSVYERSRGREMEHLVCGTDGQADRA
jgi:hypothetical protein